MLVSRANGVVTVSLNRPDKKNAATWETWRQLGVAAREVAANPNDRVLVITGEGGDFCSGADCGLARRSGRGSPTCAPSPTPASPSNRSPNRPSPRSAASPSAPGPTSRLACDLIVASDTTRFSEIFAKRGLSVDFGGSWFLPRRVGMHVAKELAFFADILPAVELERLGLVNRVVPDDELDDFVDNWAARLAKAPPLAIMQTKRLLDNAMSLTLEQALIAEGSAQAANFGTKDTAEAIAAFESRREPNFIGE